MAIIITYTTNNPSVFNEIGYYDNEVWTHLAYPYYSSDERTGTTTIGLPEDVNLNEEITLYFADEHSRKNNPTYEIYSVTRTNCTIVKQDQFSLTLTFQSEEAILTLRTYRMSDIAGLHTFNDTCTWFNNADYLENQNYNFSVNANTSDTSYSSITISTGALYEGSQTTAMLIDSSGHGPYLYANGQLNESCREINFGTTPQSVPSVLSQWLNENSRVSSYNFTVNGDHFTWTGKQGDGTPISNSLAKAGYKVTLTFDPEENYQINNITGRYVDGTTVNLSITKEEDNIYSFIMPATHVTINVNTGFREDIDLSINLTYSINGKQDSILYYARANVGGEYIPIGSNGIGTVYAKINERLWIYIYDPYTVDENPPEKLYRIEATGCNIERYSNEDYGFIASFTDLEASLHIDTYEKSTISGGYTFNNTCTFFGSDLNRTYYFDQQYLFVGTTRYKGFRITTGSTSSSSNTTVELIRAEDGHTDSLYTNGVLNTAYRTINFGTFTQNIPTILEKWIKQNTTKAKYSINFQLTNCTVDIDATEYYPEDEVTFTLSPNFGYELDYGNVQFRFLRITSDGVVESELKVNPPILGTYTLTMPAGTLYVTATAIENPLKIYDISCTVSCDTRSGFSALEIYNANQTYTSFFTEDTTSLSSTKNVAANITNTYEGRITLQPGWTLTSIQDASGCVANKQSNNAFNIKFTDYNASLKLTFSQIIYTITTSTDSYTTISVQSYAKYGEKVVITVNSQERYKITTVRYKTENESTYTELTDLGNNNYELIMPASNIIIEAYSIEEEQTQSTSNVTVYLYGLANKLLIQDPTISHLTGWNNGDSHLISYTPGQEFTLHVNSNQSTSKIHYITASGATISSIDKDSRTFKAIFLKEEVTLYIHVWTMSTISGAYTLKDNLTQLGDNNSNYNFYNINFTSNDIQYNCFSFSNNTTWNIWYSNGSQPPVVYSSNSGWTNEEYKTINFGMTTQEIPTILKDWIEENKVYDDVDLTFIFDEGIKSVNGLSYIWLSSGYKRTLTNINFEKTYNFTINLNNNYNITNISATGATVDRSGNIITVTFTSTTTKITITTQKEEQPIVKYNIEYNYSNVTLGNALSSAEASTKVSFTATPYSGYKIDSVTARRINGSSISVTKSGSTYSFTMPDSDVVVTITSSTIVTYNSTLTLSFDSNISSISTTIKGNRYIWTQSGESQSLEHDLNTNYLFTVTFIDSNYKIDNIGANNCSATPINNNQFYVYFNSSSICNINISSTLIESSPIITGGNNGIPFWSPVAAKKVIDRDNDRNLLSASGSSTVVGNTNTTLRLNMKNLSLNGSTGTSGSLLQSGGTNNASWRSVEDSTSASALSSSSSSIPTVRDIYHGLPNINGSHNYNSSNSIYAPITGGQLGYILQSMGSGSPPKWVANDIASISMIHNYEYVHNINISSYSSSADRFIYINFIIKDTNSNQYRTITDICAQMPNTNVSCFGFVTLSNHTVGYLVNGVEKRFNNTISIAAVRFYGGVGELFTISDTDGAINYIQDYSFRILDSISSTHIGDVTTSNITLNITSSESSAYPGQINATIYVPSTNTSYSFDSSSMSQSISHNQNELLTLTITTSNAYRNLGIGNVTGANVIVSDIQKMQCYIILTGDGEIDLDIRSYVHQIVHDLTNVTYSGPVTSFENELVEFRLTPTTGIINSILITGADSETIIEYSNNGNNNYSFTMPTEDVIITATTS